MEIEDKIDHIVERVSSIDSTLKFQAKQLESHIKRTEILENRITPIEDHVKFIQGLFKLTLTICTMLGGLAALLKVIGYF